MDSNSKLDKEFNKLIKRLNDKGIIFAAISGRSIVYLDKGLEEVEEEIVKISNNGNHIQHKDKIINHNAMNKEELKEIIEILKNDIEGFILYSTQNGIYSESIIPIEDSSNWKAKVNTIEDIRKIEDDILKITIYTEGEKMKHTIKKLAPFEEKFMVTLSGESYYDICKLGGNKKRAIEILQREFNIGYDETVVFGDHLNDTEMMEAAYYSFAVANAKQEVKNKARFITKSNDENGVICAIKELVFGEKHDAIKKV